MLIKNNLVECKDPLTLNSEHLSCTRGHTPNRLFVIPPFLLLSPLYPHLLFQLILYKENCVTFSPNFL